MNGSTTKFSTESIKRLSTNYYIQVAMKESRTNLNPTVVFKFPLNEQNIKIFCSPKEKSYFLRWQYW